MTSKLLYHCERHEGSAVFKAALLLEGCNSRALHDDFFQDYQLTKHRMNPSFCYALGGSCVAQGSHHCGGLTKGHCHLQ